MEKILSLLKKNKFTSIVAISLVFICGIIYCFTLNNENYYDKTIAKITYIKETPSKISNMNGDIEQITKQQIKSIIMNGKFKGQEIGLENSSSYSGVNNLNLKVGDEVFISTQQDANNKITSAKILDLKRDKYVVYITSIFIFLILLVGGFKGFRSLASVIINIIIFCIIVKLFIHGYNLIVISLVASLLSASFSSSVALVTLKILVTALSPDWAILSRATVRLSACFSAPELSRIIARRDVCSVIYLSPGNKKPRRSEVKTL